MARHSSLQCTAAPVALAVALLLLSPAPGRAWRTYLVESAAGSPSSGGYGPSLRFDLAGRPRLSWWNPFSGIHFSEYAGTTWQSVLPGALSCPPAGSNARKAIPETLEGVEYLHSWAASLALDLDGTPHIAFSMLDANDPAYGFLQVVRREPDCWLDETVTPARCMWPSLDIASDGTEHVVFDDLASNAIVHGEGTTAGWQLDPIGTGYGPPSLVVDDAGVSHAAYAASGSGLVVADLVGGSWHLSPLGSVGTNPSLALDTQGLAHVAYRNAGVLHFAERDAGGTWSVIDLGTCSNDIGAMPALALDPAGDPHIAYVNADGSQLLMASRTSGVWNTSLVAPLTGSYENHVDLSIAARPDGHLGIAFVSDPSLPSIYVASDVLLTVDVPPTSPGERLAVSSWPCPLHGGDPLHLSVRSTRPGLVRAMLFDVLGRRVAVLGPRAASAGSLSIAWFLPSLSPGLYRLRVEMDGEIADATVIHL